MFNRLIYPQPVERTVFPQVQGTIEDKMIFQNLA